MKRLLFFFAAILPLAQTLTPYSSRAQDWPMFRQDPAHKGLTSQAGPLAPDVRWQFDTGGYTYSSPVIVGDRVYLASENELIVLDNDGVPVWSYTFDAPSAPPAVSIQGLVSTPAVAPDGTVYIGSLDDNLYAIDAAGTLKWSFDTGGQVFSSPVFGPNGAIYIGSRSKNLFALSPRKVVQWAAPVSGEIVSSPALGTDGNVYVGATDNRLYAFDRADGAPKWTFPTGGEIISSPAIGSDNAVYFGSLDRRVYAVHGATGQPKWVAPFVTEGAVVSSPALTADGALYVASFDGNLYAINAADGSAKWAAPFETDAPIAASPAVDGNGYIYIASLDGSLYVLSDGGDQPILEWSFPTGGTIWASPAVGSTNRVYVAASGSENKPGRLFAIGQSNYTVAFSGLPVAGRDVQLTVKITESGAPAAGTLFYRRAGDTGYQSQPFNDGATIPAASVTGRGLEYYIEGPQGTFPAETPQQQPASQSVFVANQTTPLDLLPRVYRMISAPYDFADAAIGSVLGDDYGVYGPLRWRLFRWSGGGYAEYPALDASFEPGTAFFLVTNDGAEFDVEGARSANTSQPFPIALNPGWNQIGNPFGFPVAWNSVLRNPDLIQAIAFFDGTEMVQDPGTTAVLYPWEGYFVFNASNEIETILIPPLAADVPTPPEEQIAGKQIIPADRLRITASLPDTPYHDSQNWIGFSEAALDGPDRLDAAEAPPFGDHLRLSILENNVPYAVSFRPGGAGGSVWRLELSSSLDPDALNGKSITLFFEDEQKFLDGRQLVLIDEDYGYAHTIQQNRFTLHWEVSLAKRRFTLVAGSPDFIAAALDGMPLAPEKTSLEANYPNPFQHETSIRYRLGQRSGVTLTVYNMLGQEVRTLVDGWQNPGSYETTWDGRDAAGRPVGSGIFLYRLQTDSFSASGKMTLIH